MSIACIDQLGEQIEDQWRSSDYSLEVFPALCDELLRLADLPSQLSPDDVVRWALRSSNLPQQADPPAKFGEPPITLFQSGRFHIDALFWLDGTTAIHQHGFSGAFEVLSGSSIETLYRFETQRTFDGHFVMGRLHAVSSSLLRQGDVRRIEGGPSLIHSLFHLERPSVSIVARSRWDPGLPPQFAYWRAGIGRDSFFVEETVDRKVQLVSMLRSMNHPALEQLVGDLVADADLHTAYRLIAECAGLEIAERLIDRLDDQDAAVRFRQAIRDNRREAFLKSRRNVVADPELRFFLGVLLNAPRRCDVLTIVRQKVPDADPAEQVASWLRRLSNVTMKLQVEGVPWQPNLLGLPEIDEETERACAALFAGMPYYASNDRIEKCVARIREVPALACLFNTGS